MYIAFSSVSFLVGNREIAKAAQCILEIQTLRSESDLSGIHIIDNQSRYIQKANEDIISNAQRLLLQGLLYNNPF